MRLITTIILTVTLTALFGCSSSYKSEAPQSDRQPSHSATLSAPEATTAPVNVAEPIESEAKMRNVSLGQADASQSVPAVTTTERKIIRNAALSIEINVPADGQRRIASIAEAHGGFVVTSEARQQGGGPNQPRPLYEMVTIEVRVPAAQFDRSMSEIRSVANRITEEKITGQDVTEEYIDLEARIRTKRALEAQFLEIMKQARKVSEALEVQTQVAKVRTEIERLEGRRRFLENQASLSTIKITLQPPAPLVGASPSGFLYSVREAFGNGVDVAASITLALIRVCTALIPVLVLIVLPIAILVRLLRPRFLRRSPFAEKS